jgi:hypothetical protein
MNLSEQSVLLPVYKVSERRVSLWFNLTRHNRLKKLTAGFNAGGEKIPTLKYNQRY